MSEARPEGLTPELLDELREIFSDRIPFNHLLGLQLLDLTDENAKFRFEMREELVGNYVRKTLHGGVITSVLDVTGGVVALLGALKREHRSVAEIPELFGRLGTIDLRVDFMRPGVGRYFESSGYVLRAGSRLAVSRTELSNDEGRVVAVGTGAYIVA